MATIVRLSDFRPKTRSESRPQRWQSLDLVLGAGLLWATSVVRVVMIFSNQERFGVEPALAVACVLLLPALWLRSRLAQRGGP